MTTIYLTGTKSNSDIVHISQDDWISTYCGKLNELFSFEVNGPATCEKCLRAFKRSAHYRIASDLEPLVRKLYDDMQARPGAYLHADRTTIGQMMAVLNENEA